MLPPASATATTTMKNKKSRHSTPAPLASLMVGPPPPVRKQQRSRSLSARADQHNTAIATGKSRVRTSNSIVVYDENRNGPRRSAVSSQQGLARQSRLRTPETTRAELPVSAITDELPDEPLFASSGERTQCDKEVRYVLLIIC